MSTTAAATDANVPKTTTISQDIKFTPGRLHMTEGPLAPNYGRKHIGDSRPWKKSYLLIEIYIS
jgi:hypothetical protein